ncbi:histidine phosphatase family protein [Symbioplanes lichenis]|uniref:histidine phosphatase family protein n=1 Tax=Symbioplanes lichenis TaxID=1629072 RepID=UPI0027391C09|nr:histidine phosphatase family protein [Actinoplanes lichenis]
MSSRWLYLARHGDAAEGGGLSAVGQRQAALLGARLAGVAFDSITHSPEQRATETARIVSEGRDGPRPEAWDAVGDYVPHVPHKVPPAFEGFLDEVTDEERRAGAAWADQALARFARVPADQALARFARVPADQGPAGSARVPADQGLGGFVRVPVDHGPDRAAGGAAGAGDVHELVVTHAFQVAWFVRAALGAPVDRWLGLPVANCGLTVIRWSPGRPAAVVLVNDLSHLPPELRWTGFPPGLPPPV